MRSLTERGCAGECPAAGPCWLWRRLWFGCEEDEKDERDGWTGGDGFGEGLWCFFGIEQSGCRLPVDPKAGIGQIDKEPAKRAAQARFAPKRRPGCSPYDAVCTLHGKTFNTEKIPLAYTTCILRIQYISHHLICVYLNTDPGTLQSADLVRAADLIPLVRQSYHLARLMLGYIEFSRHVTNT